MPTVDVHQHLWPEPFVDALARRSEPPHLRGSTLTVPHAAERQIDLDALRVESCLALLERNEIDVAVVSLSPLLGFEEVEAGELVVAYEEGMREIVGGTGGRIVALAAGAFAEGFAGACVGAGRLADLDALAPLCDELERQRGFLFVHPGPAPTAQATPPWWATVVEYTAQLQAAYARWFANGAERWPSLDVVFASLAGGGPFQLERLLAFGDVAARDVVSEHVFFETSSYGRRALELCLATFGVEQVVFGSDAPVLDPERGLNAVRSFGDAVTDSLCVHNPGRLLA
jgi:hypothetical protein